MMEWIDFQEVKRVGDDIMVVIDNNLEMIFEHKDDSYINYGGDGIDGAKPNSPSEINMLLIERYCKQEFDKELQEEIKYFQNDFVSLSNLKVVELTANQIAPIINELNKLADKVELNGDRVGFVELTDNYLKLLNVLNNKGKIKKQNDENLTVKTYLANNVHS